MAEGGGRGIDLDSPEVWVVEEVQDPVAFFRHLGLLISEESVLYLEGCGISPEAAKFYEANRARNVVSVARDTLFPVPKVFHVSMGPGVIDGLVDLLTRNSRDGCFDHLKAYREGNLLFAFHDAFDGCDLLVSDRISRECIEAFCSKLGAAHRRERNENKRDLEPLRQLLCTLESSDTLRMNRPWWKKALLFWKK